jgi:hypothetical protein
MRSRLAAVVILRALFFRLTRWLVRLRADDAQEFMALTPKIKLWDIFLLMIRAIIAEIVVVLPL